MFFNLRSQTLKTPQPAEDPILPFLAVLHFFWVFMVVCLFTQISVSRGGR